MMELEENIDNWRMWCRLCAKSDVATNINIFLKNEVDFSNETIGVRTDAEVTERHPSWVVAVEQYFLINIKPEDELPKMLCHDCCNLITTLWNFSDRTAKVQQMFYTIQKSNNSLDLHAIRMKYNLLDATRVNVQMVEQSPEIHYFETKSHFNQLEEQELDVDENTKNPLELPRTRINVKNECFMEMEEKSKANNETCGDNEGENFVDNDDYFSNGDDDEEYVPVKNMPKKLAAVKSISCNNAKMKAADSINENVTNPTAAMKCSDCPRKFKNMKCFQKHMKTSHSKEVPIAGYPCTQCVRVFDVEDKLHIHLMKHAIQESRKKKGALADKKEISADVRSFICDECGVSLTSKGQLKLHMLIHAGLKPYKCEICDKNFREKGTLRRHKQIHDPTKPICSECGIQLSSRATLNQHMLVHSDDMKHKCEQCGRAFKRAKTLKDHLILHTGLKPYKCDFCGKEFTFGSSCRLHKKTMHPKELAELEASGAKAYTHNIPKLATLKAITSSRIQNECNNEQSQSSAVILS